MGSLLALELHAQGASFKIIDLSPRRCSSLVSAGMIDPISGQRFALSWRYSETITQALSVYQKIESLIESPLVQQRTIYRLFRDRIDRDTFEKKYQSGQITPYIQSRFEISPHPMIHAPLGGAIINGGYQINVGACIDGLRNYFIRTNTLLINPSQSEIASYKAKATLYCTGAAAHISPLFQWLPFRNSRGETLIFEAPTLALEAIINNGFWISPMGNNHYRAGATYAWENLFRSPTAEGYDAVHQHIQHTLPSVPKIIKRQESGTRSIMPDSRPVIGNHPHHPSIFLASGLGSKGTQMTPFLAQNLASHLIHGTDIDPEISMNRFYKNYTNSPSF